MIFSFSGIIAHWIDDDWNLVERLIDFKHLDDQEHAGEYAAKAFIKSASKRGGLNKISINVKLTPYRWPELPPLSSNRDG
jgi:hypothetical protein